MKTNQNLLLLGILIVTLFGSACGRNDPGEVVEIASIGDIVMEEYNFSGFDEVEIAGFFDVEITQGDDYHVVIKAERTLMPYLEVDVRSDRLIVGLRSGVNFNFEEASQRVEVMLPSLHHARVGNHSTMELIGILDQERLQLEVVDFSTLSGSVTVSTLQIEVVNHSDLTLSGSATKVLGTVTDFSSADLLDLDAEDMNVETGDKSEIES